VIALAAGVLVLVGGYYLFEAYLYPLLALRIPFLALPMRPPLWRKSCRISCRAGSAP
jgi:hypothetical protein